MRLRYAQHSRPAFDDIGQVGPLRRCLRSPTLAAQAKGTQHVAKQLASWPGKGGARPLFLIVRGFAQHQPVGRQGWLRRRKHRRAAPPAKLARLATRHSFGQCRPVLPVGQNHQGFAGISAGQPGGERRLAHSRLSQRPERC